MKLTKEEIRSIFDKYCFVDCCGTVKHAYKEPEHRTIMPVPGYSDLFLIAKEDYQLLVDGRPRISRSGDLEHYPVFDFSNSEWVASFDHSRGKGYYYYSYIHDKYIAENPQQNNNTFYSCVDNLA